MPIIPEPLEFDWDEGNLRKLLKHNVTQQEAEEMIVGGPYPVRDPKHSKPGEVRYQALGETKKRRRLFASFTVRNKQIRIISIRDMTSKEGQVYEQVKKHS